jgi:hypothetical protein
MRRNKGASFCQVAAIKQLIHEIEDITWGNQKWQGAAPSFSRRLIVKIIIINGEWECHIEILDRSIKAEPRA